MMVHKSIAFCVVAVLCISTAFAGNGTIRVNVEKGWGDDGNYISAKCWATDGHGTTHWERIHENNHKTCHGAHHMRLDFHVSHPRGVPTTWRFYRGQGSNNESRHEINTYLDCGVDEMLKITVPKDPSNLFHVRAHSRYQ